MGRQIDARSPSAGSPTISATLACIFENLTKRAIGPDSFAARVSISISVSCAPMPSLPAIPQLARERREIPGERLGLFVMTLGGEAPAARVRSEISFAPYSFYGSENVDC
jgi:hypothetical protein